MPKYEFLCQKCNKKYSLAMTLDDLKGSGRR
jgi:hypothetical protein